MSKFYVYSTVKVKQCKNHKSSKTEEPKTHKKKNQIDWSYSASQDFKITTAFLG